MAPVALLLTAAVLILTGHAAPVGAVVFKPEQIAWWRFEPDGFLADSVGGHALSTAGAGGTPGAVPSTDVAPGAGSSSAYFDGNDIIQTVGTLNLAPYDHIAVSWWQKVLNTSTAILYEHSAQYWSSPGGFIGVVNEPNLTPQYVAMRGSAPILDTFPFAANTWQHFTAQLNLGLPAGSHEAVKVYQDGVLVGADHLSATIPASFRNDTLYLGARAGFTTPSRLQGWLDEVKIETVSSYVNDVANHPDLVGYWRLGESAGPTAWEVKGTVGNGTYVNTTAADFSQPGAVNFDLDTAMQFNGTNSYVSAGNHPSLNGDWDGLTVAAWIKPDSAGMTGLSMIAGKWAGSVGQDHFGLFINDGAVGIAIANAGESGSAVFSQETLQANEWYFVAGTWDDATGSYQLYIDGELDPATGGRTPGTGINTISTTTMKIGAQAGSGNYGRYFSGVIDEVAVFSTALSEAQLLAYYRTATVPEPTSTLSLVIGLLWLLVRRRRS